MRDGFTPAEAAKRLADQGADVVGLNCARGPRTMLPYVKEIRAAVRTHVAALPVPYRTTPEEPTFQSLTERDAQCAHCIPNGKPFPVALDSFQATRYEIAEFGREALRPTFAISAFAAGLGRTTFARWPRRWVAARPPVGSRPICPSITRLGPTPGSSPKIETMPRGFDAAGVRKVTAAAMH